MNRREMHTVSPSLSPPHRLPQSSRTIGELFKLLQQVELRVFFRIIFSKVAVND